MRICKILLLIIFCLSTGYSQDLEKENQYNTIDRNSLEIIHNGKSVVLGEDFRSIQEKWPDAKFAGKFETVQDVYDEDFYGIADYKIVFDQAYFFFVEGKLTYFQVMTNGFHLRLKLNKDTIVFDESKSISRIKNALGKSWQNRTINDNGYTIILNIDQYGGGAAFFNDLIIGLSPTGELTGFTHYGYF